MIHADDATQL